MSLETLLEAARYLSRVEQDAVLSSSLSSQSSTLSSSPTSTSSSSYRRRALSTGSSTSSSVKANRGSRTPRNSESSHDADSAASNRHREMHKTSEKNRRAQLRDCFEQLKKELPQPEYRDRKSSHINIINCALRCIQNLKKKEAENEIEKARLAKAKLRHQNTISQLRQDLKLGNLIDEDVILKDANDAAIVPVVGAFEVVGNGINIIDTNRLTRNL